MGWCKPSGGNAFAPGYARDECVGPGAVYSETDPNPDASPPGPDGGIPGQDKPPNPGCFVASAAYGSPLEPEVEFLRGFKNDVLMKTRSGARFFEEFYRRYDTISPLIVSVMNADPRLKELVRWIVVAPIVNQLELMQRFPDASLDGVPEPWGSFLAETRASLEAWAEAIDLPDDFGGLSVEAAAEELNIVLRYILRTDAPRAAYLDRLTEHGQIPLRGEAGELAKAACRFRAFGRSEADIARILGVAAQGATIGA
jgi:hypothetical protein